MLPPGGNPLLFSEKGWDLEPALAKALRYWGSWYEYSVFQSHLKYTTILVMGKQLDTGMMVTMNTSFTKVTLMSS